MSGFYPSLKDKCPQTWQPGGGDPSSGLNLAPVWTILASHSICLGLSFLFCWVGLGVLNAMIFKFWHFQLHRMKTEYPKGPISAQDFFSMRGRDTRRRPGAQQSSPVVPGPAETVGCGVQCGPLPPLASLGNEPLWEMGEGHRPALENHVTSTEPCTGHIPPFTFNFRCLWPPHSLAWMISCFSLPHGFWISFTHSVLAPVPSCGRASGGQREGLRDVFLWPHRRLWLPT